MKYVTLLTLTNSAYMVMAAISYTDIEGILTMIVSIIGGAVALMGAIDAFSGYSNQSSGKQSEGIIKFIGGAGIIIAGNRIVSLIFQGLI